MTRKTLLCIFMTLLLLSTLAAEKSDHSGFYIGPALGTMHVIDSDRDPEIGYGGNLGYIFRDRYGVGIGILAVPFSEGDTDYIYGMILADLTYYLDLPLPYIYIGARAGDTLISIQRPDEGGRDLNCFTYGPRIGYEYSFPFGGRLSFDISYLIKSETEKSWEDTPSVTTTIISPREELLFLTLSAAWQF